VAQHEGETGADPPGELAEPVDLLDPHAPDPNEDDELLSLRRRRRRRLQAILAAIVALALVVPLTGSLVAEWRFRTSGRDVATALGDDADLAEALLLVRAGRCDGSVSTGSAFVVDLGDGPVVVTNRHVVAPARTVGVRPLAGGPGLAVTAVQVSGIADVAVLELADPGDLPPALAAGGPAGAGDTVRLVGFPAARPFTTDGVVTSAAADELVVALATDPGASGSPLVDAEGRVVGQVFARTADGRGIATPTDHLAAAVREAGPAPGC
jgi:S1-C subfamily serine protease